MHDTTGFDVVPIGEAGPHETVIAGVASPDLAGLTAADYLVDTYDSTPIAYIRTRGLPDIAAVTDGRPRHPVRVYRIDALEISVLVSEVFVPVALADRFADALSGWLATSGVTTLTLLHGGQFPHGEEEHVPFLVATDAYRDLVAGASVDSLPSGMFDGLAGELLLRGLEDDFPPSGVIVTPVHLPAPDIDAALTLLEGFSGVQDVTIDDSELQGRSEQLREYYEGIADRMRALQEGDRAATARDFPEDRMYM